MDIMIDSAAKSGIDESIVLPTSENTVKELFENCVKEKGSYDPAKISWKDDETVELTNFNCSSVHDFFLQAEEMGKKISIEKKTVIKITD